LKYKIAETIANHGCVDSSNDN